MDAASAPEEPLAEILARLKAALADRYAIDRELGHGGTATVYLAQDLKHGRSVAIKVLRPELAAAISAERFLREIEIAARLTHPISSPCTTPARQAGYSTM
jgi:serine/threonine-protein kinase